jgi:hypothetical protein
VGRGGGWRQVPRDQRSEIRGQKAKNFEFRNSKLKTVYRIPTPDSLLLNPQSAIRNPKFEPYALCPMLGIISAVLAIVHSVSFGLVGKFSHCRLE